ncbi:MAG: caspase family protein [Saprospiraceae bacterium]
MKTFVIKFEISLLIYILCNSIIAQKGVTELPSPKESLKASSTYAVIIGISDYQSPQIPDLQFADRDAKAFADWLKSPAGGKVPAENITILLNDTATTAAFIDGLNFLSDSCKEGDLAIIYFSGHGDVETKIRDQWGFLLCYDSPARNYVAGSCPINYLQSVISTLSLDRKTKVLVITDACHAGKLAGSRINGSNLTNANLAQQFANEIKILSCQTNEFSLEGKQWGDGRGVFSWVLIDGLNGLADNNEDELISLMEIGRYLEEKVPYETNPHLQIPITVGDRSATIAKVDENYKREKQQLKLKEATAFVPTNMKGMESGFVSATDTLIQRKYRKFLAAIESHQLMFPKDSCANDLYESLKFEKALAPLCNLMRRNLAIALQNEVQQALNAILMDDPFELNNWHAHPEKYSMYPIYLKRAIELLGDRHFMTRSLKSKKLFFEAYLLIRQDPNFSFGLNLKDPSVDTVKQMLNEAIELEPNASYLYNSMGSLFKNQTPCQVDSVIYWNLKAIELSPNWLKPIFDIGFEYLMNMNDACKTASWIEKAIDERPDSYLAKLSLSWLRQWQGRIDESKEICLKLIEERPELYNAYATMAMTLSKIEGDYNQALYYTQKAIDLDSFLVADWIVEPVIISLVSSGRIQAALDYFLRPIVKAQLEASAHHISYYAMTCFYSQNYKQGLATLDKYLELNLGINNYYQVNAKFWQGRIYLAQAKVQLAKNAFHEMFEMDKTNNGLFVLAYAWLAECSLLENRNAEAEEYFNKAVSYRFCGDGMDATEPREEAHYLYARYLLEQNRMPEAKIQLEYAMEVRRMGYWGEYGMAAYFAILDMETQASNYLKKALDNQFPFLDLLLKDKAFEKMSKSDAFKQIINNYSKKEIHK